MAMMSRGKARNRFAEARLGKEGLAEAWYCVEMQRHCIAEHSIETGNQMSKKQSN